jgi:hypothetical protein
VKIFFVDTSVNRGQYEILLEEKVNNTLLSYAYKQLETEYKSMWGKMHKPSIIIDSGAFTAFTSGKTINPKDYAYWALNIEKEVCNLAQSISFMNLDVIGDQDASWDNQKILEALGMSPIPIITFGCDKTHLLKAINGYDYIALGGLVPYSRQKDILGKWLNFCFRTILDQKKDALPKIHLLGITSDWVLKKYPAYSCDSSSWTAPIRFGKALDAGIAQIPKWTDSKSSKFANLHAMRAIVKKLKKIEHNTTKLWESRGITWND